MAAERGALMEAAYPELQAFCQKHGLMFEVIDLRWGIHDGMGTSHAPTELFLEEIRRCQKLSVGPSFIALLGSHYGPCPAPQAIPEGEFEALRSQLRGEPHALQLLARWYLKDENSTPPVYTRQRLAQASPARERSVVLALRRAAQRAEQQGSLSQEQRLRYHKSETQAEIEAGLFGAGGPGALSAATVFFREAEGPDGGRSPLGGEEEAAGPLDAGEQRMLADLKTKIATLCPEQLRVHRVPPSPALRGPRHKPQPRHLKELGQQVVAATSHHVLQRLRAPGGRLGQPRWLFQELAHHGALGRERAPASCWRQGLLAGICRHVQQADRRSHPPLVVCGPPGCGKTALLCRLGEAVRAALGRETVVALRLLGTSPLSSRWDSLLRGLCLQLSLALGWPLPGAQGPGSGALLFHRLLLSAPRQGAHPSLVLILDSLERLQGAGGAGRGAPSWLPKRLPPQVHLVISTTEQSVAEALGEPLGMPPLSPEQAQEALAGQLASAGRALGPGQRAWCQQSFSRGGQALPVALALREAQQWASYTPLPAPGLLPTAREAAHRLCRGLEQAHGAVLVGHALGYLACARHGLSEAELKDILSLDNEVLAELYRGGRHPPPNQGLLRLPPLLWAQLHRDLAPWLEPRWADGFLLMGFRHREFASVVQERYLPGPEERLQRHLLLADFFRGTWSWGMKKPVGLPSASKPVSLDRKVTPQPLWLSRTLANQRKLSELPFHLLQAGRTEELQRDVWGNMDWTACRVVATGVGSLVSDLEMCLVGLSSPELGLLRDALLLLPPALEPGPEDEDEDGLEGLRVVVYTEMLARLSPLAPSHPGLIGALCQQCQDWFAALPHPVLVPLCGFLYPPGGPLRRTLAGAPTGTTVLELSPDQRVLLAGSPCGLLVVWDVGGWAVRHILTGHSAEVRCVRVFGKGTRAASVALDHTLRLWSLVSGRQERAIPDVQAGEQNWCQLHVDERQRTVYWASGSEVKAWSLETGVPAFQIPAEPAGGGLCAAVFVPRLVAMTLSERGTLCLWDSLGGQLHSKQALPGLGEESVACGVLLQERGRMVAGFSQGSLLTISSDGNSQLEKLPAGICCMALSEDESLLATGFGQHVRVFLADLAGLHPFLATDLMHDGQVHAAAISADNTTLCTSSDGDCIWVWSLTQQGLLTDVLGDTGVPVTHLALCSDNSTLVSASRHAPVLRVWDLGHDCQPRPLPSSAACVGCVALSRDARYVCFPQARDCCNVVIWDSVEGEACDVLDTSAPVRCLEVAEQRNLLFVGLASGTLLVFPLDSRQDVGCVPPAEHRKPPCSLALTRDEAQLAVACDDWVQVLEVGLGEPAPLLGQPAYTFYTQIPGAAISCLALLAGYRVLYGMTSGELFLYSCPQAQVFPLEAHSSGGGGSSITCLATSHGEKWAASGSADAWRCLWDVELCCWEHQMLFRKQDSSSQGVLCACFSKDDRYLFTGSLDQCVTVWDVSQGEQSQIDDDVQAWLGALLAVQFVHMSITRIVPTADGFVATTRLGYLVRERFRCPQPMGLHYDPLGHVKATCQVRSRKKGGEEPGGQPGHQKQHPRDRRAHPANKLSQVCRIV
ncbi:NACHT domain- and WD repeat-containing protein 1 [Hemicordylus capensis]|uniref:NACHT domain- and WD repeat-containing protein 1 n=1 Tax=Hemicordylus capensis TaxID=884348 RepID=UPI002302454C|nr:NACHT domain- and WD repeat-containing protein 1 [Hemicordylus capensis]